MMPEQKMAFQFVVTVEADEVDLKELEPADLAELLEYELAECLGKDFPSNASNRFTVALESFSHADIEPELVAA